MKGEKTAWSKQKKCLYKDTEQEGRRLLRETGSSLAAAQSAACRGSGGRKGWRGTLDHSRRFQAGCVRGWDLIGKVIHIAVDCR